MKVMIIMMIGEDDNQDDPGAGLPSPGKTFLLHHDGGGDDEEEGHNVDEEEDDQDGGDSDLFTSSPCLHPWLTQRGSAGLFHIR